MPMATALLVLILLLASSHAADPETIDSLLSRHLGTTPAQLQSLTSGLASSLPFSEPFPALPPDCTSEICLLRQLYALLHVSFTRQSVLPFGPAWGRSPIGEDPRVHVVDNQALPPPWLATPPHPPHLVGNGVTQHELLIVERHQIARFLQFVSDETEFTSLLRLPSGPCMEHDDLHLLEAYVV